MYVCFVLTLEPTQNNFYCVCALFLNRQLKKYGLKLYRLVLVSHELHQMKQYSSCL